MIRTKHARGVEVRRLVKQSLALGPGVEYLLTRHEETNKHSGHQIHCEAKRLCKFRRVQSTLYYPT